MKSHAPAPETSRWKSLITWIRWALTPLVSNLPVERVESLAVDIYTSMGASLRQFHTLEHIFHFQPEDPVETLAVLYHDIVYWSVDGDWPTAFAAVLTRVADHGTGGAVLAVSSTIPHYAEVLQVFGVKPGDPVGKAGGNELFSALAFASALGDEVDRNVTLAVCTCIEATIPFRGATARPALRERLLSLGVPTDEADSWVTRAVHMANQDVGNFRSDDPGNFLGGTWNLLPELNPDLRITAVFTIQSYRRALEGMHGFFLFLTPELLFDSWGDEPGEDVLRHWQNQAAENLQVARRYISAKILATALLEAFALATGNDIPISLFMGASADAPEERLESLLPPVKGIPQVDSVSFLLEWGRSMKSSFDLTNSPLAAWVYRQLEESERDHQLERSKRLFSGSLAPREYLAGWKGEIVRQLATALASFVPTRREQLGKWLTSML